MKNGLFLVFILKQFHGDDTIYNTTGFTSDLVL